MSVDLSSQFPTRAQINERRSSRVASTEALARRFATQVVRELVAEIQTRLEKNVVNPYLKGFAVIDTRSVSRADLALEQAQKLAGSATFRRMVEKAVKAALPKHVELVPWQGDDLVALAAGKGNQKWVELKLRLAASQRRARTPAQDGYVAPKTPRAAEAAAAGVPRYLRALRPSGTLAAVVGTSPRTQSEAIKAVWAYVERQGLQDRLNRRMINADDRLRPLFGGQRQVSMFELTKLIARHLS